MLEKKNFYINGTWTAPKNKQNIEVINPENKQYISNKILDIFKSVKVKKRINLKRDFF